MVTSEYFFIDCENMPMAYNLGFDENNVSIIFRIHRAFIDKESNMQNLLGESSIVKDHLQNSGFTNFFGRFDGRSFGFDGCFQRLQDEGDFYVFSAQIPLGMKTELICCSSCCGQKRTLWQNDPCRKCDDRGVVAKPCDACQGSGNNEYDDNQCLYCNGTGIETNFDWLPFLRIVASLEVFFNFVFFAQRRENSTRSVFSQILIIDISTRGHRYGISGIYSIPLARWLTSLGKDIELKEVSCAMRIVWQKIYGKTLHNDLREIYVRANYGAGCLTMNCPGDRCITYVSDSLGIGRGCKFSDHNVDNAVQLLTFLVGYGALCDYYTKNHQR